MDFSKSILAERLKQLRSNKKLKQSDLAEAVGVTHATISMIERAQRAASIEVLHALANYFNVPIDYLMGNGLFAKFDEIIEYRATISDIVLSALEPHEAIVATEFPKTLLPLRTLFEACSDIDFVVTLSAFIADIGIEPEEHNIHFNIVYKYIP